MADRLNINVEHLTRVEGHGNIVVNLAEGRLEEARFEIVESPQFFEAIMRGRDYQEVVHIAARVCGICSISHTCAALKATEAAFGVELSEQALLLRRLAYNGEIMGSHVLHVYFLAAPDFFEVPSVFPLANIDKDVVLRAMRMKKLSYDLCVVVAGRHTHPVAMTVGGFSFVQDKDELARIRSRLAEAIEDTKETVRLFKEFTVPEFERETEYVSLKDSNVYALYDCQVYSSEGETIGAEQYHSFIEECVVRHSTAKHARWHRPEYMVGALARVNNNFSQLHPLATESATELGLTVPCFNPFMNTVAQIVEIAHCVEDSIELIDTILDRGIQPEAVDVEPRAGRGVGVIEAPRGTLFHEYEFDLQGKCVQANLVIPTAQNLANLDADMRDFVPHIAGGTREEITQQLEMLVRAYDPCISCATHMLTVEFS